MLPAAFNHIDSIDEALSLVRVIQPECAQLQPSYVVIEPAVHLFDKLGRAHCLGSFQMQSNQVWCQTLVYSVT